MPAFGLGPVPRLYTAAMEEVYLRVRELGVRLTYMIDDMTCWAATEGQAMHLCRALVELLAALGFYLRPDKCQLRPSRQVRFLGLIVDSAELTFRVPDDKLQRFLAGARALLGEPRPTPRSLAKVGGQLLSFTPAVDVAPLLARGLFHLLRGTTHRGWDVGFTSTASLVDTLRWCVEAVPRYNGTRMFKREPSLLLAGDASAVGTGIFTPGGELEAAGLPRAILTSWDAEQLRQLGQDKFSSGLREIIALREALRVLSERARHLLLHRAVQYMTDSQVAMSAINRMGGNPSLFVEVKGLWQLCKELDCELSVVWQPREHDIQRFADELSKLPDESAWALHQSEFDRIASELPWFKHLGRRHQRQFTVDLFADAANSKLPRFFSRWFCPGTAGIDAFAQRWDWFWCPGQERWRRHMGYCNGPFTCMGRILRKIIDERADVALVYPQWPRSWRWLLMKLRALGVVRAEFRLRHFPELFQAGARTTAGRMAEGKYVAYKTPHYAVWCAIIAWDEPGPKPNWKPSKN